MSTFSGKTVWVVVKIFTYISFHVNTIVHIKSGFTTGSPHGFDPTHP
jgi:hypothetical protein